MAQSASHEVVIRYLTRRSLILYPDCILDTTNADVGGLRQRTALDFSTAKIDYLFHTTKHFGEKVIFRGIILLEIFIRNLFFDVFHHLIDTVSKSLCTVLIDSGF